MNSGALSWAHGLRDYGKHQLGAVSGVNEVMKKEVDEVITSCVNACTGILCQQVLYGGAPRPAFHCSKTSKSGKDARKYGTAGGFYAKYGTEGRSTKEGALFVQHLLKEN